MRLTYTLFILLSFSVINATGQPSVFDPTSQRYTYRNVHNGGPRLEVGVTAGTVYPFTDIAPSEPGTQPGLTEFHTQALDFSGGVFARYRTNDAWGIKAGFSYFQLQGKDEWSSHPEVVDRGRTFKNQVFEFSLLGELYVNGFGPPSKRLSWGEFVLFGGPALFYHNPTVNGDIIDNYDYVQQNDPGAYNKLNMAIPVGMGFQYNHQNRWTLGMDVGYRFTFMDFLDGFNRPYSTRPDHYMMAGINFAYIIDLSRPARDRNFYQMVFGPKESQAGRRF